MTITEFLLARIAAARERTLRQPVQRDKRRDRHEVTSALHQLSAMEAVALLHESQQGADCPHDGHEWPCPTTRFLAAAYRDHPDYRPEWAL